MSNPVKCVGRYIQDKNRDTTRELGEFFVSCRPATALDDNGKPRFIILSLHGSETLNATDAFHFSLYPENATELADRLLDLAEPEGD